MRKFWFLFLLIIPFLLGGCLNTEQNNEMEPNETPYEEQNGEVEPDQSPEEKQNGEQGSPESESDKEDSEQQEADKVKEDKDIEKIDNPEIVADKIVSALAEKDMETLANFVHPSEGVRFSPYGYVSVDEDLVFMDAEVKQLMDDDTVYHWGVFDGKGNPIEKTFAEYYERFVYDEDYLNAEEKSVDERLGHGNTLDNTGDVYPDGTVVEYHFSGFDPQYVGMDWRSLRLVLEKEAGQWYLVGIIHDEWTI